MATGIQTGMRTGSRAGLQAGRGTAAPRGNSLSARIASIYSRLKQDTTLRHSLALILILCGGAALLQWSRWLQSPEIRRLEEPAATFLQQTAGRSHLEVLQLQPLLVVATANVRSDEAQHLERALSGLLNLDTARGERFLLVRGQVPLHLTQFPLLAAIMLVAGVRMLRLRWRWPKPAQGLVCRRRRSNRLGRILVLAAVAAVAFGHPLLSVSALGLELLRRRQARPRRSQRDIVNGPQEAAIILMSQPPEYSAQVFKLMGPEAVHSITLEISKLPPIPLKLRQDVLGTFERHLEEICRRNCAGCELTECEPHKVTRVILEIYLNSVVRGGLGLGYQPGRPRRWLRWLGLVAASLALAYGLTRHDPASLKARQLHHELSRFLGPGRVAVEVVHRDGRWSTAVALLGVSPPQASTALPLLRSSLERAGLDPARTAYLSSRRRVLNPRVLGRIGGVVGLAALLGLLWRQRRRLVWPRKAAESVVVAAPPPPPVVKKAPERLTDLMRIDPITVEVGRGLLSLVDPNQGAKLLERVGTIRRQMALELGVVLPGVRFRDNLSLAPNEYVYKVSERVVAGSRVEVNRYLVLGSEEQLETLPGPLTHDPTFGLPGRWIGPELRMEAQKLKLQIFDPVSVMASHLTEVCRAHAADLITFPEVEKLLKEGDPAILARELGSRGLDTVLIWQIFQRLARERVSIRDLVTILQTLLVLAPSSKDPDELTEGVRRGLAPQILSTLAPNKVLEAFWLPRHWTDQQLLDDLPMLIDASLSLYGRELVIVTPASRRRQVQRLVPSTVTVLSEWEITDDVTLVKLLEED